jgi:hypothetical protein
VAEGCLSQHVTKVVPHDHVNCHTARHIEGGDCGTRFEARCSCGWAQGAISQEAADALAVGHRGYSPDAKVIIARFPEEGEITDDQLRDLFARHCECRPLDLHRTDHAAIHDCDTGILRDVQIALGIVVQPDDIAPSAFASVSSTFSRILAAKREARARCAEHLALVPNDSGGYRRRDPCP